MRNWECGIGKWAVFSVLIAALTACGGGGGGGTPNPGTVPAAPDIDSVHAYPS